MKVGGNESATKYFQSHGGTAALSSKDPKVKYTSNAATKYKDELKRRASADAREYVLHLLGSSSLKNDRYPEEVIITDIVITSPTDGTGTPSNEPGDDFFSSWDKPAIKRPSNPPSRTQTPPVISRTSSPFLNPNTNGNGVARPKSPLVESESSPMPATTRTISSSAIRKTPGTGAPRKANVLGAKKPQKLGAKKIGGGEAVDFEAAEKKAKEEAERIAKLGYDPEAEKAAAASSANSLGLAEKSKIASPTPISPAKGFGATKGHGRSESEVERLGMGVGKLGFGQVGGTKPAASAPKKMGFGSMGSGSRSAEEGASLAAAILSKQFCLFLLTGIVNATEDEARNARSKFGAQKGISSDEYFGRAAYDPVAQSEAKTRLQGFEGATSISSNAYFGRPEDDIPQADEYGNYGDLEGAARDFVRKFGVTAADDLENLSTVLGEGASRLQGSRDAFFLYRSVRVGRIDTDLGSRCDTKLSQQLNSTI